MLVATALLIVLGAIFLRGFGEAILLAVILVGVYLLLNVIVLADGLLAIVRESRSRSNWTGSLFARHGSR